MTFDEAREQWIAQMDAAYRSLRDFAEDPAADCGNTMEMKECLARSLNCLGSYAQRVIDLAYLESTLV